MSDFVFVLREMATIRGLIDVALISAGILFAYRNLTRLGAWRTFAGLVVIFAVFVAAQLGGLTGTTWILSQFGSVALIALVVLFQPELRQLFDRAAMLYTRRKPVDAGLGSMIVSSVEELIRRRWGAIFVLSASTPCRAFPCSSACSIRTHRGTTAQRFSTGTGCGRLRRISRSLRQKTSRPSSVRGTARASVCPSDATRWWWRFRKSGAR